MKARGDSGSWEGYVVDDEQLSMLQLTLIWTASTLAPQIELLAFKPCAKYIHAVTGRHAHLRHWGSPASAQPARSSPSALGMGRVFD